VAAPPHGGPAAPVLIEPATAAEHPVAAVDLGVVDVPAPVPGVTEHVVQAPRIRPLAAHVVDPLVRVAAVPGDVIERPVMRSGCTGAARVLPLSLGRQSVPVSCGVPHDAIAVRMQAVGGRESVALGQGVTEPDRVPPGHANDRKPVPLGGARPLAVTCAYCAWMMGNAASWYGASSTDQTRCVRRSDSVACPGGTVIIAVVRLPFIATSDPSGVGFGT
jgi:hypothetical protein